MTKPKLDLTMLKELVAELEEQSKVAELTRSNVDLSDPANLTTYRRFFIELTKANGLLTAIAREASELEKRDIPNIVRAAGAQLNHEDHFDEFSVGNLLSGLVPSGNKGN